MKRIVAGIVIMGLVLSVSGATVFAAGGKHGRNCVDSHKSGVCDDYSTACQFADTDGDGFCDNCGSGCSMGYVDADDDGFCDNCGSYHQCGTDGTCGLNFVDTDGDEICDNHASGHGRGKGCGSGGHGHGFRGGCGR